MDKIDFFKDILMLISLLFLAGYFYYNELFYAPSAIETVAQRFNHITEYTEDYRCYDMSQDLAKIYKLLGHNAVIHCGFEEKGIYYVLDDNCTKRAFVPTIRLDTYHAWVYIDGQVIESTTGKVYNNALSRIHLNR